VKSAGNRNVEEEQWDTTLSRNVLIQARVDSLRIWNPQTYSCEGLDIRTVLRFFLKFSVLGTGHLFIQ
jgi:hypothetical protein